MTTDGRPLLFYSAWPLGYHNTEAARKASGLVERGYDVTYVAGVGTRNPSPASLGKLVDRVGAKLRDRHPAAVGGIRLSSVLVAPPRQMNPVRTLNARWLERQLRRAMPSWSDAVAWIRWPTPELVDALPRLAPAVTVYECVDAHHHSPGIRGRWAVIHEAAERDLVRQADLVVVPGEVLAARFREWGADVRVLPHGVDPMDGPLARKTGHPPVVGFVGTLDYRLDVPLLRTIAAARPEWRFRLIGPVQEGFDPSDLAALPNVTIEPPVPHGRLGSVLTGFDVGMMPYADTPNYQAMTPVKTLELMAAGCPAVARPSPALVPYAELMYLADTADDFLAALDRALAEDSPERIQRRRSVAASNSWERRMDEVATMLREVLTPGAA